MIKVIECNTPIYVDRIFCINLEKYVERKQKMIDKLNMFNLTEKVEFVKGIYNKIKPTIGCRTSHFKIIEKAFQSFNKSNIDNKFNKNVNERMILNSKIVYGKDKPKKENNEWYSHYKSFIEKFNNNYDLNIKLLVILKF